jgi:hypothetical protein
MSERWSCSVCGETVDESNSSICTGCGGRYHLNQRNDREGKDCGTVWVNEHYLALEFACQRCLDASGPQEPPKPQIRRPRIGRRRYRKRA